MRQSLLAWTVESDLKATQAVYRRLKGGAAEQCACGPCRNFHAARPAHFPADFLDLLSALRIDPRKEAAVRLVTPLEGRRHLYAGSYAFCGEILAGRPFRGFPLAGEEVDVFERIGPGSHVALRPWADPPPPWGGQPCVRVEFLLILPWILREPGAPLVDCQQGPE